MIRRHASFLRRHGSRHPALPHVRIRAAAWLTAGVLAASMGLCACSEQGTAEPPSYHVITVEGSPYERGFQHGRELAGEIRYFYTKFLTAGILPWFNREKSTVDAVLTEYQKPEYDNGQFAYKTLLMSGENLLLDTPEEYVQEMQGVADGSGVPFDRILILNTFLDTLYGMRALIFVIRNLQDPRLQSVAFEQEQGGEWAEVGRVDPFVPSPFASITEIPTDARIRFSLFDPEGIDKEFVRVQMNKDIFIAGDPALEIVQPEGDPTVLEVLFTPPRGMEPAALQSLQIQAGDRDFTDWPPPEHSNVMRDERTAFTTQGYAEKHQADPDDLHEVRNLGDVDIRLQPTSLSFAVRDSATTHGQVLAAHHFVGLDNDTAHKCGLVTIHKPSEGKPFVTVGMAGVIWGSSGMSSDGLAYMYNLSDTLDNPVSNEFLTDLFEAKLISSGTPIGFLVRQMLQETSDAQEARAWLEGRKITFGWNVLLADRGGNLAAVELDTNLQKRLDGGHFTYSPPNPNYANPLFGQVDKYGRPWASVGPDDLRMAMHFQANHEDIWVAIPPIPILYPQRFWTTYYYRSLRAFYLLGDEIEAAYGSLDLPEVERIMRIWDLNDQRNSMNAAIYAPDELKMWFALGEVPATSAPFREVDFGALIGK